MNIETAKKDFVNYIFFQNAYQAAVTTRNKKYPVFYQNNLSQKDFETMISGFRYWCETECNAIATIFKNSVAGSYNHVATIREFCEYATNTFGECLKNRKLRFGVAQKMINLYLKFLWCIGEIQEPPHCPVDGYVKIALGDMGLTNWTEMTEEAQYQEYISKITSSSPANWELLQWSELRRSKIRV